MTAAPHDCVSTSAGHMTPPQCTSGTSVIVRRRTFVPPLPHALSHALHVPHAETAQSLGEDVQSHGLHDCWLHGLESVRAEQAVPVPKYGVVTLRWRLCIPPPHFASQTPQAPQCPTAQLASHGCVLQCSADQTGGHSIPPFACCTRISRARTFCPPPQHLLQLWSTSSHGPRTQSTGQAAALHTCSS